MVMSSQAKHDAITVEDEAHVSDYLETLCNAAEVRREMQAAVQDYKNAVPFLQPGRLVRVLSHVPGPPPFQTHEVCRISPLTCILQTLSNQKE